MEYKSYWHETAAPFASGAAGPVAGHNDVAVIGAGFTGLGGELHGGRRAGQHHGRRILARRGLGLRQDGRALRHRVGDVAGDLVGRGGVDHRADLDAGAGARPHRHRTDFSPRASNTRMG